MDQYKVGYTIARLRKENGYTQRELASQLGISNQAVSKWERGENLPDITYLMDMAKIFGVKVDDILNGNVDSMNYRASDDYHQEASFVIEDGDNKPELQINSKRLLEAISISTYIFAPIVLIILQNTFGLVLFFLLIGGATFLNILSPESDDSKDSRSGHAKEGVFESIVFTIATLVYLIMGFMFSFWHPGWIIFLIASLVVTVKNSLVTK